MALRLDTSPPATRRNGPLRNSAPRKRECRRTLNSSATARHLDGQTAIATLRDRSIAIVN
jgi:hypothetical protein